MTRHLALIVLSATALMAFGCSDNARPATETKRDTLQTQSHSVLKQMKVQDPNLQDFLNNAYGYAIFPSVGKGGLIVGGATGHGEVYRQGHQIGWAELQQASIGAQAGGQTFAELIVFKDADALNRFTNNKFEFEANASAVILKAGASKEAPYNHGVAVFTMPEGGAMFEAAIGGQRFVYTPLSNNGTATTQPSERTTDVEVHTR